MVRLLERLCMQTLSQVLCLQGKPFKVQVLLLTQSLPPWELGRVELVLIQLTHRKMFQQLAQPLQVKLLELY